MKLLEDFLIYALPRVGEALVAVVGDYFRARPLLPVPPSIQPWIEVNAKHDARIAARRAREGK